MRGMCLMGVMLVAGCAVWLGGCRSNGTYDRSAAVVADSIVAFGDRALRLCNEHADEMTRAGEDGRSAQEKLRDHGERHAADEVVLVRKKAWLDSCMHDLESPPSGSEDAHASLHEMYAAYLELHRRVPAPDSPVRIFSAAIRELRGRIERANGELRIRLRTE